MRTQSFVASPMQSKNACRPTASTVSGNITDVRPVQFANADDSICLTDDGIAIHARFLQSANAPSAMFVTPSQIVTVLFPLAQNNNFFLSVVYNTPSRLQQFPLLPER